MLFTTNRSSYKSEYSNIHVVAIGDLEELPALEVEKGVSLRGIWRHSRRCRGSMPDDCGGPGDRSMASVSFVDREME